MKFERFVALRYLTRRKGLFAIITTLIGVAGVSVGVAALITTLSVMNGFQSDIKTKVIGAQSHILVFGRMPASTYPEQIRKIEQIPLVEAAAPHIYGQAILSYDGQSVGLVVRGLDPEQEKKINSLSRSLTEGSFAPKDWAADAPAPLVLGTELAAGLGADVGNDVVLISPQSISTSAGMFPKMKKFRVSGLLRTGYYEFDNTIAYAGLADASDFLGLKGGVTGVAVKLHNLNKAEQAAQQIREAIGLGYSVRTFAQLNSTLYAALKLEKAVMFIILFLIIIVASLNIAGNLILLGTEKLRDIGLMRAMGASPKMIRKVFMWEAMVIATLGICLGIALACLLCWIIATFNIVELPGDIYYLTKVPVRMEWSDILAVVGGSYFICFFAGLYPAAKASRVNPTDAIRYG
ncbi:MAG: ABC transporter permease [Elusimicrobiaceae bacterium]|uniref:FtsX-like permease family protein n=1 Tax=Candidatus Avelusimicrobium faecicola TaxID=3416205 RepID=UPI002A7AA5DB|nr:ABC transporter permease [Spirochaetota bacterium]MDY2939468.1 ABC transporter permease [Elusimicrobiaceae bacterium]